jgi:TrpR-related protein YerC/YecD
MNNKEGLGKEEIGKLFYSLCIAISDIKNPEESAELLKDIVSYSEAKMIAKRLKIAELILNGNTYEEIREKVKVGYGTIARVQEWLKLSGDGYRKAILKLKKKSKLNSHDVKDINTIDQIKKSYPAYFWPEALIETLIKSANKRQLKRIDIVLSEMDKMKIKTALYSRIDKILKTRKKW